VKGEPTCPRCGGPLHPPSLWSSAWQCPLHGYVEPLQPVVQPTTEIITAVAKQSQVPLWLPWPLPHGWLLTGIAYAGDERTGAHAVAVACSGPNPVGGAGECVFVAEEMGVGLGARFAGLPGPDPGNLPLDDPPHAKLHAGGHPTHLWNTAGADDRAVYVGESGGNWLWAVLWPESAAALLLEDLVLTDLREVGHELEVLPLGALSPRLLL
jgi:hypothetical protein